MLKNIIFAVVIAGIVILLYVLSMKEYPHIPPDKDHINITTEEGCNDCHGKDRDQSLSREHPPKYHCLKCHERELSRD